MAKSSIIPSSEVVLIGSGLSNLEVIYHYPLLRQKSFRLTLINASCAFPFPGSMAEFLEGGRSEEESHVDLGHLCLRNDTRFIHRTVEGIDLDKRVLHLTPSHATIPFDVLSIDFTSECVVPESILDRLPGRAWTLRPLPHLPTMLREIDILVGGHSTENPFEFICYIECLQGAELVLALAQRLHQAQQSYDRIRITLICPHPSQLSGAPPSAMKAIERHLKRSKVRMLWGHTVADAERTAIVFADGQKLPCQGLLWGVGAQVPAWLLESGLATTNGKIAVTPNFESKSHDGIYVLGDLSPMRGGDVCRNSYPNSAGTILSQNIYRKFLGLPQLTFKRTGVNPRWIHLSHQKKLLCFNKFAVSLPLGALLKSRQDETWLGRYQTSLLPTKISTFIESGNISEPPNTDSGGYLPADIDQWFPLAARDRDHIRSLIPESPHTSTISFSSDDQREDLVTVGQQMRPFISDLFDFAHICSIHTQTLIHRLGYRVRTLQAMIEIAYGPKKNMARDLYEIMAGLQAGLRDANDAKLISECLRSGPENTITLVAQSWGKKQPSFLNQQAQPGDRLILTKPLGTGVLFSGFRWGLINSGKCHEALATMRLSHETLLNHPLPVPIHDATAATGHGLASALAFFARRNHCTAQLFVDQLPTYEGVMYALDRGVRSSLHTQNRIPFTYLLNGLGHRDSLFCELLFDPQTAAGLVLAVAKDQETKFIKHLQDLGFHFAAVIGELSEQKHDPLRVAP